MRVIHISGAKIWGGNEKQLEYIVEYIAQKNETQQALFCYEGTPLAQRAEKWNIKIFTIPAYSVYSFKYWKALANAITDFKANIAHVHTSDAVAGFMLTDVFFNPNVKAIYSKKGLSRKMTFLSRIKYSYKGFHKIIFVSQIVKTAFEKMLPKALHQKFEVIPDGLKLRPAIPTDFDLKKTLNLSDDCKIIAHIGNHAKRKNIPLLIDVCERLKETSGFQFKIIQFGGFSNLTEEYKTIVREKKHEENIVFLGFNEQLYDLYPQFDVFVITSSSEGGPSCLFEAFYHKVPVTSTRVGIVEEASNAQQNALVCAVDDAQCLAENIKKLLTDKSLSDKIIENAYKTVQTEYTAEVLGEKHYKVYRSLLG